MRNWQIVLFWNLIAFAVEYFLIYKVGPEPSEYLDFRMFVLVIWHIIFLIAGSMLFLLQQKFKLAKSFIYIGLALVLIGFTICTTV